MNWMLPLLALSLVSAIAPGPGLAQDAPREEGDLIVYGKVRSQEYSEALDELGVNGIINAQFRITRVVKGPAPSSVLRIRYIAHTYFSEDREFRFRLRRTDDGTYLVCSDGGRGFICEP